MDDARDGSGGGFRGPPGRWRWRPRPWAVARATAIILASALVVFAAANSGLYLLGSYRLKHKGIMQMLGRTDMLTPAQDEQIMQGICTLERRGSYSSGVGIGCIDYKGNVHPDQFWWHYDPGSFAPGRLRRSGFAGSGVFREGRRPAGVHVE